MAATVARRDPYQRISRTQRRTRALEARVNKKSPVKVLGNSVKAGALAANSVTVGTIAANAVTSGTISAGAVTATSLAADSVTAAAIAAGTITAAKIATGTITATQIAAATITSTQIQAGAINADRLYAGGIMAQRIQATNIAAGAITTTELAAGTITATNIHAGAITATLMAADSIATLALQANAVTAGKIAANTITAAQIAAGTITATEIAAATVTASNIAGGTITATQIASGTITSGLLAANAVTSTAIASGAVTATKISVASLSAVSAALGTVTSGTLTGATVQTNTTGARVVLSSGGLTAYNASSVAVLNFDTSTGNLTLSGTVTANASSVVPTTTLSGTLTTGQIGTGNVTSTNILDGTIAGADIAANTITANNIVAATITATELAASSITAADMLANTITAGQIASGTITATQIATGTITADRMSVTALSAITANLGTITAGTITGATFQTAPSGARVVLDATGLHYFNATPVETLRISSASNGMQLLSSTSSIALASPDRSISWTTALGGGAESGRVSAYAETGGAAVIHGIAMVTNPAWGYATAPRFELKTLNNGADAWGGFQVLRNGATAANAAIRAYTYDTTYSGRIDLLTNSTSVAGGSFNNGMIYLQGAFVWMDSPSVRMMDGWFGQFGLGANWWGWGATNNAVTDYAFLAQGSSDTFVNAALNHAIYFRHNNQNIFRMLTASSLETLQNVGSGNTIIINAAGVGVKLANNATAWAAQSDIRTKEDVRPLGKGMAGVRSLRPITYRLKFGPGDAGRYVGLIAQDVQPVLPEAVSTDDDGMLSLRMTDVVPLVAEGLQEVDALQTKLEAQVAALGDLLREFAADTSSAIGGAKGAKLAARFADWQALHAELAAA